MLLKIHQWSSIGLRINWNFLGRRTRPCWSFWAYPSELVPCIHTMYLLRIDYFPGHCPPHPPTLWIHLFTSRTLHIVLSLPGIHFSWTCPLVWIPSTYLSGLLSKFTFYGWGPCLWAVMLRPPQWALLLTSSHCRLISWVLICPLIILRALRSRLSFRLCIPSAQHSTWHRAGTPRWINKVAELGFKVRSFLSGTNLTFLHATS